METKLGDVRASQSQPQARSSSQLVYTSSIKTAMTTPCEAMERSMCAAHNLVFFPFCSSSPYQLLALEALQSTARELNDAEKDQVATVVNRMVAAVSYKESLSQLTGSAQEVRHAALCVLLK